MSYRELPRLPSFTKCIISLWFRVPQASLDAIPDDEDSDVLLANIMPLVVFGKRGHGATPRTDVKKTVQIPDTIGYAASGLTGDIITIDSMTPINPSQWHVTITHHVNEGAGWVAITVPEGTEDYFVPEYSGQQPPTDPSFIGLRKDGTLRINFETNKAGVVDGNNHNEVSYEVVSGGSSGLSFDSGTVTYTGDSLPFGLPVPAINVVQSGELTTLISPAGTTLHRVDNTIDDGDLGADGTGVVEAEPNIKLKPDRWHHILASVDLKTIASGPTKITRASKLYVAIDDKNYIKSDLSNNWAEDTGGNNDIATDQAFDVLFWKDPTTLEPIGSYTLADPSVPPAPLGLPGTQLVKGKILQVEMGEFQMWLGKSLDTASVGNRRLFITKEGEPQTNYTFVEKVLGKPQVRLHRSGNWKKGKNTGTLKSGFDVIGKAETWKPDPSLFGPQQHNQKK
jgi:hypothetical protein